ncbi:hypothetical protein C1645_817918 [Glomus cerebriforme]|uniref:Protein kinase domain-containing protein n=1 Tax=Glomus cerebriforme TaxID=658196 RepID=A0A397TDY7_9GLOM|nr:hypothetical protein C1645_817918 [Glomus cerebriforme]
MSSKDDLDFDTLYSAIWRDGPLYWYYWDKNNSEYIRKSEKKVALKCLSDSQNITNITEEFLNKVVEIYGISQNPDTKEYIMVFHVKYFEMYCTKCDKIYTNEQCKWCKLCQINQFKENFTNWTSRNEEIDDFIQEINMEEWFIILE